jgi:hypothetical protein
VAKLEASLARAKRNTASLERLFKVGGVAKVEVERSALKEIVLKKDIALARLRIAQTEVEEIRAKAKAEPGESTAAALKAAEEAAETANTVAKEETAVCRKAQLDAAELNLYRWRRLLAVGAARKVDVSRAQEQLAALQQAPATP